jgi:rhamnose transport system substrate-binding protein
MFSNLSKLITWLFIGMLSMSLSGCLNNDSQQVSTKSENTILTMGMVPKVIGSTYFDKCAEGARAIGLERGIEVIYKGPTTADAASQVNIIQDMIFRKVDILAISPIDPAAVEPILKQAQEAGILVVTFDADVNAQMRSMFISQVSGEVLGKHLMDHVASGLSGEGQFAILTASLTAPNQNSWITWMEVQLKEKYPNIQLISVIPTDEDQQTAYAQTQNLIQAYPELKAIVALSTVAQPGAARAIELLEKSGEVLLYGLALPNDMRPFLKSGSAQSTTLWDPYDLGALTVHIAKNLYHGVMPVNGSTYGDIGPVKYLERDGIVIMGQPLDFTKENVDDYDF